MPMVAVASPQHAENMAAARPDLFENGRAVLEVKNGTLVLNCIDEATASEIGGLDGGDVKPKLTAYAANKRWLTETGGITVTIDGQPRPIATTIDSQSKIADLNTSFVNGTTTGTVSFKCADGTFFEADAADVGTIYAAVINHVQLCYTAEQQAQAGIAAGTTTTEEGVDAFFAAIETLPPARRRVPERARGR